MRRNAISSAVKDEESEINLTPMQIFTMRNMRAKCTQSDAKCT